MRTEAASSSKDQSQRMHDTYGIMREFIALTWIASSRGVRIQASDAADEGGLQPHHESLNFLPPFIDLDSAVNQQK